RNRSHWSTSKTPSYTKSVSWQHYQESNHYPGVANSFIEYFSDVSGESPLEKSNATQEKTGSIINS
ncbi:hypothetical protein P2O67_25890, partial [Escherichia coli]